jgi:hypothetical protein
MCLRMYAPAGGEQEGARPGKNEGVEAGRLDVEQALWAMQPIDKGSSPPVGSDRNNGELGSGDGHWAHS